jgi:hypothetical protein
MLTTTVRLEYFIYWDNNTIITIYILMCGSHRREKYRMVENIILVE